MNQILSNASLYSFLLFPPLLLFIRFFRPRSLPWWAIFLAIVGGGWLLVNATVYFRFEHLADLVESDPNPSAQLLEDLSSDGAPRVFAMMFGWLYGIVYSVPFLVVFFVARMAQKLVVKMRADATKTSTETESPENLKI